MNILGLFARRPVPGRTKTRLAVDIGASAAADLYAAFVTDLLSRCGPLSDQLIAAVTPQSSETESWFRPRLPVNGRLWFQPEGSLGIRMDRFFEDAFASDDASSQSSSDSRRIVLMGTDSPDLPDALLKQAFGELDRHDLVLGPAADGGFTLVGMNRPIVGLWGSVPFSSPATLSETLRAAGRLNLRVKLLPLWYDVDTVDNLGLLQALQHSTHDAAPCPATQGVLKSLQRTGRSTPSKDAPAAD